MMKIEKEFFGKLDDGTAVDLFTLTNNQGVEARITNYGATVTSLAAPDRNGKREDIVLGFDSLSAYRQAGGYLGAIVGRFGNRIANGAFTLDGREYSLAVNNGPNHLHGGENGFDKVLWQAEPFRSDEAVGLRLSYVSEDMEEGYPGQLTVGVVYSLTNDNQLVIEYTATTDKATIVNLTNHAYFNLTGNLASTVLGHDLKIEAQEFVPVDQHQIPLGETRAVAGTPFDFRAAKKIGQEIDAEDEQIRFGRGYDHTWVLGAVGEMKPAATVHEPESGRVLEVWTTEPGIQFYSGNFLDGTAVGREQKPYNRRDGFCLETQHFPNSPNQPQFPSTVLRPGETYRSKTIYRFSAK